VKDVMSLHIVVHACSSILDGQAQGRHVGIQLSFFRVIAPIVGLHSAVSWVSTHEALLFHSGNPEGAVALRGTALPFLTEPCNGIYGQQKDIQGQALHRR
jgi:hypothetical protein